MIDLHWISWHPTPYHDYLFRSLAAEPEINLSVHFVKQVLSTHPWQSKLAQGFNSRTYDRILGLDWHLLRLAMRERRSFFVVSGWNETTMFSLINLLMLYGRPFAIWTDTPNVNRKRASAKAIVRETWLRMVFNRVSYMMGTGEVSIAALRQLGCSAHKLVNFPFYVDINAFRPAAKKARTSSDQPTVFLSSGRLINAHKGYDIAIKALGVVKERINGKFCYRIAGQGPDKGNLELLARQVGVLERIEFMGWLEPASLPAFYNSGDVFLHTSRFDPYPNAVLEAMASGLPVIGSDAAGSVQDRIVPMKNGLIHHAEDVNDLAEKIIYAILHPEAIHAMGVEARRTSEAWPIARAIDTVKVMVNGLEHKYSLV